jgi:membrane protein DedA with SNARE-associated domain
MLHQIIAGVTIWITHVISALGLTGVGFLMAIESAAIPLPSEIIMPFAGFLAASGRFNLWSLALAGAIGSTVGSLVTYYLGYHGGKRLVNRYGHLVHISAAELELTEKFFKRFGRFSALAGRLLPVVRTFISIPAGIARMPLTPFLVYAFVGSFVWSYFLAWLGKILGDNWEALGGYFHKLDIVIVVLLVLAAGWWLNRHLAKRRES